MRQEITFFWSHAWNKTWLQWSIDVGGRWSVQLNSTLLDLPCKCLAAPHWALTDVLSTHLSSHVTSRKTQQLWQTHRLACHHDRHNGRCSKPKLLKTFHILQSDGRGRHKVVCLVASVWFLATDVHRNWLSIFRSGSSGSWRMRAELSFQWLRPTTTHFLSAWP